MTKNYLHSSLRTVCALGLALSVQAGWAADATLAKGEKFTITALDMEADAVRLPVEMRDSVLAKPATVNQIVSNLYVRRAMADKAQTQGLANDPAVAAALQVARDKVLSDALLSKIEKESVPTEQTLQELARNIYNSAKPDRFTIPEQLQLRHILIAGNSAESRQQANRLLQDLKAGGDFAKLAQEHSADKGSGARGGDLGMVPRGRMVPEFEQAAFALQNPNELSGIVETKFGLHIVQLLARQPARQRTFEEVQPELRAEVTQTLQQRARVAEAERLLQGMQIDKAAIEAFSASHQKAP